MAEPSHDPKRQVHLNVELPADLDAIYSNIAFITHSPSEMIIDFGRVLVAFALRVLKNLAVTMFFLQYQSNAWPPRR